MSEYLSKLKVGDTIVVKNPHLGTLRNEVVSKITPTGIIKTEQLNSYNKNGFSKADRFYTPCFILDCTNEDVKQEIKHYKINIKLKKEFNALSEKFKNFENLNHKDFEIKEQLLKKLIEINNFI